MSFRTLFVSLAILCLAIPALAVDIVDIHANTSAGVPTMLNQIVTVDGIVTSPNNLFSTFNLEIYVQDATGGINVFASSGAGTFTAELGDSVTVTAPVKQYNGLTELGTTVGELTLVNHGGGHAVPAPLVITCADLEATFQPDYSEPNEARLIRINGCSIVGGDPWPVTVSGSNSIININDGTATTLLFIDKDSPVNGSPDPGSPFDIIGVVKQYDATSPYTAGYEISPRYMSDVISYLPGPPIVGIAEVLEVTSTTATIYFETSTPGSSEIEYGADDSYGSTAGDAGAAETEHTVMLTGLDPNSVLHFRAKSGDVEGTTYGPDQLLATANDLPGELHVYMSFTADHSYADAGNEVPASQNMSSYVTAMINAADYSVDACLYSFSVTNVRDALIAAHNRGVLVRLMIEADNAHTAADACAAAGIPYIDSQYGGNHGSDDGYGIMHNKFVVIDGRDADRYNDWVWTGSANMSIAGNDDVNNGLQIQDYGLAQCYTLEFNEMWGSDTQTPNSATAKFGSNKQNNTPHEFLINGLRVEQYMSPSDDVEARLEEAATSADHSIYFAILAFTNYNLSDAMRDRRDALGDPNFEIRGVFDEGLGACANGSIYYDMIGDPCSPFAWAEPADVWVDYPLPGSRLLHHKYMVVDANWTDHDPLVATGSHNYSFSANSVNDENTLILHSQSVANMYLQEFAQRYHESGGTGDLGVLTAVDGEAAAPGSVILGAVSSYPNPFNPTTNISFTTKQDAQVDVKIYDASGRLQRVLAEGRQMGRGLHVMGWDGTDEMGNHLPSGTYFTQIYAVAPLNGHNEKGTHKLVLIQ